jgi:hypothetical protein
MRLCFHASYEGRIVATFYTRAHPINRNFVSNEKSGQQTREEFYLNSAVRKHIKAVGVPKTTGAFREMVASGSELNLDGPEGTKMIETLCGVTFAKHPQQINVMDKTSGKIIVSIPI